MTVKFNINNILNGYNDPTKIVDVYRDLRRDVLIDKPIQKSNTPLSMIDRDSNWRDGEYLWELYNDPSTGLVMLEFGGGIIPRVPPRNMEEVFRERSPLYRLVITLHDPVVKETETKIKKILVQYPQSSERRLTSPGLS